MKLDIGTRRWAGVPFYLRAGKRLGRRVTEIAVVFKRAPQQVFADSQTSQLGQNALVIRVQPDEGVTIRFGSKVPGAGMQVRDVTMDFGYGHAFTEASPEAYERLILDVLLGDPPLFPRQEEVELSLEDPRPHRGVLGDAGPARAVPPRHLGPSSADELLAPRRTKLEAAMIVELPDTTTSQVSKTLVKIREEGGVVALGRVLTLVIATSPGSEEEAIEAANDASREHPMRVIVVSSDPDELPDAEARLDAEIRVGGDAGASEVIVLRACGDAAHRRGEPRHGPPASGCPGGHLVAEGRPARAGRGRARPHRAPPHHGCLDAARPAGIAPGARGQLHARATPTSHGPASRCGVRSSPPCSTSRRTSRSPASGSRAPSIRPRPRSSRHGCGSQLDAPDDLRAHAGGRGSHGIHGVRLERETGAIELVRDIPGIATLRQPGQPVHDVALPRRNLRDCLADELRRLDPDELYGEVITSGLALLGDAEAEGVDA